MQAVGLAEIPGANINANASGLIGGPRPGNSSLLPNNLQRTTVNPTFIRPTAVRPTPVQPTPVGGN